MQTLPQRGEIVIDTGLLKRVAELCRERVPSRASGRGRRGYEPWRLAALCVLKAALNLSFGAVAELAPAVVGIRPHHTTVWRAWLRMRGLAEGIARELAAPRGPSPLAADATGLRSYRGPGFKLHVLYDVGGRRPVALRVTDAHASEAKVLPDLLARVKCDGVLVADAAYFGRPQVLAAERAGLLPAIRPRRAPRGCRRRAWARRYEDLFHRLRDAYRLRALVEGAVARLKALVRWLVYYTRVDSADAHAQWLHLALVA